MNSNDIIIIHLFLTVLLIIIGMTIFAIFLSFICFNFLYPRILLEGFSRELYDSFQSKLEDLKDGVLEEAKDLAKMNIQTLHSLLIMAIAVAALIFSLYNLLKPANRCNTTTIAPYNDFQILILLFLLLVLIITIISINYRWYKIYIKLVNIKIINEIDKTKPTM